MNYTPEQISEIVLKVLKEVNEPNVLTLSLDEKLELTQNPNTPVKTLKILATDKNSDVRCGVARNPKTPVEIVKILATDKNSWVRYGVAQNPNTPVETFKVLATDNIASVRWEVAKNPNTPVETLKVLATDNIANVRIWVAENPNYKSKTKTLELTQVQYDALKVLLESSQVDSLKPLTLEELAQGISTGAIFTL
jgi:predicted house-cleaning NTP pyrophosphatase (Maf/HAM1 superfamily)